LADGAEKTYILSKSGKWIAPRNFVMNALVSWNILGRGTIFSRMSVLLLRNLFYRDMKCVSPHYKGMLTDAPAVNPPTTAEWIRCDVLQLEENGIFINKRQQGVPAGGLGRQQFIAADMIIMATGFKRPSLNFLPGDCFEETYSAPNWYLQTFPPTQPSISAINWYGILKYFENRQLTSRSTYLDAIGIVGNWNIGMYTRILIMFLVEPRTRPSAFWMRRWIDMTKVLKSAAPTLAFDFLAYLELVWWLVFCIAINPFRWKWALFVFLGLGYALPEGAADLETRALRHAEHDRREAVRDAGTSF
jgi:hypothetical protein